jgi:pyrroline-5-carboxylate reductase
MRNIGIIGYGSMGKMIFSKIAESKIVPESNLFLAERAYETIKDLKSVYPQLNTCENNKDAAKNADFVFLCVKAPDIKKVLTEILPEMKKECHIVSLNASVLFRQMDQICAGRKISKITPNISGEIKQSITLVSHNAFVSADDKNELKKLLECFGSVVELPEGETGIAIDLTSCMPGFIAAALKLITDEAAKQTTIPRDDIVKMLLGTVRGTANYLLEKDVSFEELVSRVATRGGITEEGTKIINLKLPEIISEVFAKTTAKMRMTTENVQKDF